jgi:hypothetical protein
LAKGERIKSFKDECVIYFSQEDRSWIAHSLYTDQLGYGDCVVDALVDLFVGTQNLIALHVKDPTIEVFCDAPKEIQNLRKTAKPLGNALLQVAYERYVKKLPWPMHIDIPENELFKTQFSEPQKV